MSSRHTGKKINTSGKVEAVIFVAATMKSKLQRRLQAIDDEFSRLNNLPRIKFVERNGSKVIDILGVKNPLQQGGLLDVCI